MRIFERLKKDKHEEMTPEQNELLRDYYETIEKMHHARNVFEYTTEPELIEACVYEMKAINAHYSYLLSRIKNENIDVERAGKWRS